MKKLKYISRAGIVLLIAGLLSSACDTARVQPEFPTPNPPVPAAQPLILTGYVKDLASLQAVAGATVKITKADKTLLATLAADNKGKYVYDASAVSENSVSVSASKEGYGFKSETASILKASNSAAVNDILLAKLVVASSPVTVATGGTASTASTQSVSNQPLTVTVPPNAVSQTITLTASSIPAGQIPQPSTTSTAAVQSAGQFGPSGTVFTQPVTISFPLPAPGTPGATFQLLQLNEETGTYSNSGFTATVDASGTQATAPVTHFTIYALSGDITGTLTDGPVSRSAAQYYALSGFSGTGSYSATNTYSAAGATGSVSAEWLKDVVAKKLEIDFATSTLTVGGNFPELPSKYQINGVQTNPDVSGKGNWEYRWYVIKESVTVSGTLSGGDWIREITVLKEKWVIDAATGWYWISHDQGGTVSGPY